MKQNLRLKYINRITAIEELLANPPPDISADKAMQHASESIFDLWVSYENNNDFQEDLEELIIKNPELIPEFEILFTELPQTKQNQDAIESLRKSLGTIAIKLIDTEANDTSDDLPKSGTSKLDYLQFEDLDDEITSQENQSSLDLTEDNLTSRLKVLKILFSILGLFILVFAYSAGVALPILVIMLLVGLWILLNPFSEK